MRIRTAAVLLAIGLAMAGCSSSSHDDTKPKTPSTVAAGDSKTALEAAVRAYSADFFKPDADAGYAMLSINCKSNTSRDEYGAQLAAAAKLYGRQQIKTLHVDQLSDGLARVTYTYSESTLNQTRQPWATEDGVWKYDGC
jgi:hypothetical protein